MKTVKDILSEYDKQAEKFLSDVGATIKAEFQYYGPHFDDDKTSRDVYRVTIERKGRVPFTFNFGQSITNSGSATSPIRNECKSVYCGGMNNWTGLCKQHGHRRTAPTAYDVLSCLTKNDPGTFADFCADYGYDSDSIKAQKTYFAVQEEWNNVRRVFGDVLDVLREIQ
jgi:hypothetical protein